MAFEVLEKYREKTGYSKKMGINNFLSYHRSLKNWTLNSGYVIQALIDKFQKENTCLFGEMSTLTGQGVMGVRNKACDSLLAFRVESKLNSGGKKAEDILSRLHVAVPKKRDDKVGLFDESL